MVKRKRKSPELEASGVEERWWEGRLFNNQREADAVQVGKRVESANTLTDKHFQSRYLPQELMSSLCMSRHEDPPKTRLEVMFEPAGVCRSIEEGFKLIEATSAEDYRNSEVKWSPAKKKAEMRLPDMRYITLQEVETVQLSSKLAGFVSFMITYEDGREVIYVYEIHLAPAWQGKGIGKKLMQVVEQIGRNVGLEKAMLTVFKSNQQAVGMYQALGYCEDEFSPRPRKLRNGTVKEASYVILSKSLKSGD